MISSAGGAKGCSMLLDFSDHIRTGISKLISWCALMSKVRHVMNGPVMDDSSFICSQLIVNILGVKQNNVNCNLLLIKV